MKITRLIRKKELKYDENFARANGHIKQFNEGGCSFEWCVFGYEAEGTEDEIMALVRYYRKKQYSVIPDEFRKGNTIQVNHQTELVYFCFGGNVMKKKNYDVYVTNRFGEVFRTWGTCKNDTDETMKHLDEWAAEHGHIIQKDTYREYSVKDNSAFVDACMSDIAGFKR